MSFLKKYSGVLIITALFLSYSTNCYSQKSNNSTKDEMGIVHNDQTGIVLNVVEQNKKKNVLTIKDQTTGHIYKSIPTKVRVQPGEMVIYKALCHCTCKIERACKE